LGSPVGMLLSVLTIVALLYDLTAAEIDIMVSMALLTAIVGGIASVFCYSWTTVSEQPIDHRIINTKEIRCGLLVFCDCSCVFNDDYCKLPRGGENRVSSYFKSPL